MSETPETNPNLDGVSVIPPTQRAVEDHQGGIATPAQAPAEVESAPEAEASSPLESEGNVARSASIIPETQRALVPSDEAAEQAQAEPAEASVAVDAGEATEASDADAKAQDAASQKAPAATDTPPEAPAEAAGAASAAGEPASDTPSGDEATENEAAKAPNPAPAPKPRPIPRPRPMPGAAAPAPVDDEAVRRAAAWGRVDDEGNVYLRGEDGERLVGQYAAGGSKDDALALYARRYVDLASQVALLESRVENISPEEAGQSIKGLEEQLKEPAAIGDVKALRSQVAALKERVAERREQIQAERKEAKAKALEERTKLVERAEAIAAKEPKRIHWRNSRDELNQIFEDWKSAQRSGPRIDRPTEEELWHRFSRARSQFDRMRRQHFSQLEAERSEVVARKNSLIERAEALQDSTDWGSTAAQFRSLMDEWRKAGRASRKDDDKLWARFHAAQQKFFDARLAHFAQRDEEQGANLEKKLTLIEEAEKILPIEDLEDAKKALHSIQDRWEAIGMVPRSDVSRTEGRLREIEEAVRRAEDDRWRATDPQKKQRSDGMAAQLEKLISELDEDIAQAEAAGDEAKAASLRDNRAARQAWLDQVQKDL